jgi:hypothetical protein
VLKPASLQGEYSLIYSGDPSLDLPDDETERARLVRHAQRTGQWPLRAGSEPTVFHLRPMTGTMLDWWHGETVRRNLAGYELASLALRMTLVRIDNFGGHKVAHVKNDDGVALATDASIDALYSIDPDDPSVGRTVVAELGNHVIERATKKLDPL